MNQQEIQNEQKTVIEPESEETEQNEVAFSIKNLNLSYGPKQVLKNISMDI